MRELLAVTDQLTRLYDTERAVFEEDELRWLAIVQLWIALGETARRYRSVRGIPSGTSPWSEVIAHRDKLAHLLRGEVNRDLLWHARQELEGLQRAARGAGSGVDLHVPGPENPGAVVANG